MKKIFPILVTIFLTGCHVGYKVENGKWAWVDSDEDNRLVVPVENADQNSFQPIKGNFAKDNKHVFLRGQIVAGADPGTFVWLGNEYSRDNQKVFFQTHEIKNADPKTFQVIQDGWGNYAMDKNRAYYYGIPIEGVDVKTFQVTGTMTAKDQYRKYRGKDVDWLK
jgi:hypothetical protein